MIKIEQIEILDYSEHINDPRVSMVRWWTLSHLYKVLRTVETKAYTFDEFRKIHPEVDDSPGWARKFNIRLKGYKETHKIPIKVAESIRKYLGIDTNTFYSAGRCTLENNIGTVFYPKRE